MRLFVFQRAVSPIAAYHRQTCSALLFVHFVRKRQGLNEVVTTIVRWSLRLIVIAMGAVLFLSLLVAVGVLAMAWSLRALWARLTGRPVMPWAMRMDPRHGFNTVYRSTARWTAHTAEQARQRANRSRDVTDVQPREIRQ